MNKMIKLYKKYEEIINYLIVGVATTIFSWAACLIFAYFVFDTRVAWQNTAVNIIGWVFGVVFAYFTNRKFVFKSHEPDMFKEFIGFSAGRVTTLVLDILVMLLMVNLMGIEYVIAKLVSSVLVMIGNYILSKFFIFKEKND